MGGALQALRQAHIDWRLVLMGAVLVGIALIFNVLSGGIFLSPENLYNIAQQTAVVGIVATVVVLIIVARHIDLSVGSVMGFVGVLVAYLMYTAKWSWPAAALAGLGVLAAVRSYPRAGGLQRLLYANALGAGHIPAPAAPAAPSAQPIGARS